MKRQEAIEYLQKLKDENLSMEVITESDIKSIANETKQEVTDSEVIGIIEQIDEVKMVDGDEFIAESIRSYKEIHS